MEETRLGLKSFVDILLKLFCDVECHKYGDWNIIIWDAYACKFQVCVHLMMDHVIQNIWCISDKIKLCWLVIWCSRLFLWHNGMDSMKVLLFSFFKPVIPLFFHY